MSVTDYNRSIDALDRAIVTLTARLSAHEYELLVMIREFDERGGFLKWGLSSCAEWLHFRCDLSLSAAREKVRVAHALKCLPEISAAFERGVLTYSKARALTRVATRENETALLAFALSTTAARVEARCRQMRNAEPESTEEVNRTHARRSLSVWRDGATGTLRITVELPMESGELLLKALDQSFENLPSQGPEFVEEPFAAQQADALVAIAKAYLAGGERQSTSSADHYQVMLHVDHSALEGKGGRSDLPVETLRRLTCDGSLVPIVDAENGEPLNVGRKRRTVNAAIKRALWSRDGGCRFPGCSHTRFIEAHHCVHWIENGETSVENTMLLCSAHHRLVHEGGYTIHEDRHGRWYFRRPDGRAVPAYGYRPEDMIDDEVDGGDVGVDSESVTANPSAEGFMHHRGANEVGEPRGVYELRSAPRSSFH